MNKRFIGIIALLVVTSGCSLGIQQRWTDFNAFYNTFYNARQSFDAGMRSMENQRFDINAERPIRVHRTPVRAGQADFERAIEKSADILREHRDSRWVDDALELIGKSYFFLGQYFSAEQKFNEILQTSLNEDILQRAVYWRGRVYLETNRYVEGISYLNANLTSDEYDWNRQILLEIHLILAQLHVQLETWEDADHHLTIGTQGFRNDVLRSRAVFLHGQTLERLTQPERAMVAYNQVSRRYPEYQLIFLSQLRRNQLIRQSGDHTRAHRNFITMSRDDKNFEQLSLLEYEIGRTLQAKGDADNAFLIFENVLYNSLQTPTRETIAKTHYALAELYRFDYGDFKMAAIYYDSSSRSATDLTRLPESFDASSLATSFGEYARLSTAISHRDSLIHLASLPRAEFESRILAIRDERLREFEREQRQQQLRGTTVVTVTDPGSQPNNEQQARESGFLNHRNAVLVAQASESFGALWDGRPLVDNWRRLEAVRQAIIAMESDDAADDEILQGEDGGIPGIIANVNIPPELDIDLSEIPFTEADKTRMRTQIANLEYELGNVFYLNLNMPDSALVRYLRVAEEFPGVAIRPQAMYSIADIYLLVGDEQTATQWALAIIEEYPSSKVASRIASRLNLDVDLSGEFIDDATIAESEFIELLDSAANKSPDERIYQFTSFTQRHPKSERIVDAIFTKALAFAEIGRTDAEFSDRFSQREQLRTQWEEEQELFSALQDSAIVALQDTTLADDKISYYQAIADSSLVRPDFDQYFPYLGASWDSTRAALSKINEFHASSRFNERATAMLDVIRLPRSLLPEDPSKDDATDTATTNSTVPDDFVAEFVECNMLDEPLRFFSTVEDFISESGFKDLMRAQGVLSGDFEFDVSVDHTGKVTRVVPLIDDDVLGLSGALRELLLTEGSFSRPQSRGAPVQTMCYFSISVDL